MESDNLLIQSFQFVCRDLMGNPLPARVKPFVDDGNIFRSRGGVPAITHSPDAKGTHTVHKEVPVDELVRVALCRRPDGSTSLWKS